MNNQAYDDTATRNPRKAYTDYENSTYTVVSKVAYLIGVQKRILKTNMNHQRWNGMRNYTQTRMPASCATSA